MGGHHRYSGYGLYFESAPISPYCSTTSGYGDEATHSAGNYAPDGEFPIRVPCRGPVEGTVFEWRPTTPPSWSADTLAEAHRPC